MPDTKDNGDIWELRQSDNLIGTLEVFDTEDFWYKAHFVPTKEFEPYEVIFSEGNNIPDEGAEQLEWGKWWEKINSFGMRLIRLEGKSEFREFILYINDDRADFRV